MSNCVLILNKSCAHKLQWRKCRYCKERFEHRQYCCQNVVCKRARRRAQQSSLRRSRRAQN